MRPLLIEVAFRSAARGHAIEMACHRAIARACGRLNNPQNVTKDRIVGPVRLLMDLRVGGIEELEAEDT